MIIISGGRFDYRDEYLKTEIFGYGDKWSNVFEDREISELVWDVFELIHEYDWYASCDTSEASYLEAKRKFKEKWLGKYPGRVKRIIDEAIEDARDELYKTFGYFNINK